MWVNAEEQAGRERDERAPESCSFIRGCDGGSGLAVSKSSICCAELWAVPGDGKVLGMEMLFTDAGVSFRGALLSVVQGLRVRLSSNQASFYTQLALSCYV